MQLFVIIYLFFFSFFYLNEFCRLVGGWQIEEWRLAKLPGGSVLCRAAPRLRFRELLKNILKETRRRKANSSPFLEPEPLTRNGRLSVFVFPAEMCTITVTKQNLPLHNRPAQTLSPRPRAPCCACQTRTHQRVEGSKIDWVILADVSSAIPPRRASPPTSKTLL